MDSKLIGSILLIVGTSIGAGMLALPIATAQLGFFGAMALLISCWFVMTSGAFVLLEVNLWLPQNSNVISMAKATIGPLGQAIAWLSYLFLLYSLLCAYIAGGGDLFHALLLSAGYKMPLWIASFSFTAIFAFLVYLGIRTIDYTNRGLMFVKFSAYFILIFLLIPHISTAKLSTGSTYNLTSSVAIMVTMASFGYAPIIPSLRIYFAGDIQKLKKAIYIGSVIPLICYIAWDAVIMGIIPLHGPHGLISILHSGSSNSDMAAALTGIIENGRITFFTKLFTSICVLTSFLGVSLCLTDFLSDGLNLDKAGSSNLVIHALTFMPPLLLVVFFPGIFIKALEYAGILCVILLILLPAWMCWRGRPRQRAEVYKAKGGKLLLIFMLLFSIIIIGHELIDKAF